MDLKNINLMNNTLFKTFMTHKNNRELVVEFIHSVTGIEKEVLRNGTFVGEEKIPNKRNREFERKIILYFYVLILNLSTYSFLGGQA